MDSSSQSWICPLPSLNTIFEHQPTERNAGEEEARSFQGGSPVPHSPASQGGFELPLPRKEATYLMHYIKDLASWIDVCDPNQSFGREVPKRSRELPLLSYSILAFSSRHLSLISGQEDPSTETYYGQAVRILIPLLNDPVAALNENVLVGIILLRLYEEISDADTGTHLLGSSRLLNTVSAFAAQGGLGEAASWIVLRQDIYLSLTRWQPLRISLESYKSSSAFKDTTDESWANRAIFLCGQVLDYSLHAEIHLDTQTWANLNSDLLLWYESVPWRKLGPYFPEVSLEDPGAQSVFPSLWVTQPTHALGYQHFYLARLLLTAFAPSIWKPGFEALKQRAGLDEAILRDLRMIIGLAISNPSVFTVVFTAHHILYSCGTFIKDEREREAIFRMLEEFTASLGWKTDPLVRKLRDEWY